MHARAEAALARASLSNALRRIVRTSRAGGPDFGAPEMPEEKKVRTPATSAPGAFYSLATGASVRWQRGSFTKAAACSWHRSHRSSRYLNFNFPLNPSPIATSFRVATFLAGRDVGTLRPADCGEMMAIMSSSPA